MASPSPKDTQIVVLQYLHEVNELNLPDLASIPSVAPATSPYLNQLKLDRFRADLPTLKRDLDKNRASKHYTEVNASLNALVKAIDEKTYVNKRLIELFDSSLQENDMSLPLPQDAPIPQDEPSDEREDPESLTSLRQRLLAGNKYSSSLDQKASSEKHNQYHESLQEDLLSDLTSLAATLRTSAMQLGSKILDDTKVLGETGDNMAKNEGSLRTVGNNLNSYVLNKSGGKIGFWFLLKVAVSVALAFLLMVLLTRVLPKM